MRRLAPFLLLLTLAAPSLKAGETALFYENEEFLRQGKFHVGTDTPDGVLVPASLALKSGSKTFVGRLGDDLRASTLLRLDNELNVAIMKWGDRVVSPELLKMHQYNSNQLLKFLPKESSSDETDDSSVVDLDPTGDPFLIMINGTSVSEKPISLPVKRKKSEIKLKIIRNRPTPVWNVKIKLSSKPKLGFFKKGKRKTLNDVPQPKFRYDYLAMFKPLKPKKSFSISIDISQIKMKTYDWELELKSKQEKIIKKFHVEFKS